MYLQIDKCEKSLLQQRSRFFKYMIYKFQL